MNSIATADSTASAFLRAIRERLDDDAPRLIYADWLDENGEPEQAEFIRVQIAIAGIEQLWVEILNDEIDWSRCDTESGIAGRWCPNCGDCTCKNPEESMNDDDCPLHSPTSTHCRISTAERKIESIRCRERELLWYHEWDWLHSISSELHRGSGDIENRVNKWLYKPVWVRGFLSAVTVPMSLWVGGDECQWCDGSGNDRVYTAHGDYREGDCLPCGGTGHTPGYGPAICHADMSMMGLVTFGDKKPLYNRDMSAKYGWQKSGSDEIDEQHRPQEFLPEEIFDLLEGGYESPYGTIIYYECEAAAISALSDAAIRWASK